MLNIKNWLAAAGFVILLGVGPVVAGFWFPDVAVDVAQAANGGVSLDEAVSRVRRQGNGKILSAETVRVDGRPVHRIKVLTQDGRVKRLLIDAQSGRSVARGR